MVRWTIFMRYAMTSDRRLLLIAVTPEDICHGESGIVAGILDAGFDYVHLRHPAASLAEVKAVIEDIPHRLRRRLRLHGHFGLVHEFNLGGLHLNRRCPSPPCGYQGPVSRSCHSVAEVTEVAGECDYVTLSPIFPSISKPGYSAEFSPSSLSSLPAGKVVALGGLDGSRALSLESYPFGGYAFLGAVWGASDPVATAAHIVSLIKNRKQ